MATERVFAHRCGLQGRYSPTDVSPSPLLLFPVLTFVNSFTAQAYPSLEQAGLAVATVQIRPPL